MSTCSEMNKFSFAPQYLIIPDGQIVPAIYEKVFGPASYKACDEYIKQHAKAA